MAIKSQKFLPQGKDGGSLAVRPKTNLVPIKKQSSSLANIGGKQEDPMLVIKTKVIKIEDILKGTLAAEKRAADEKRKAQEQEDRSKQENEVEAPKTKGKGIKIPVPGKIKSFWGNIQKYIGTVLFGWLGLQLLPLLPKLMPIVKFLATTADFIINIGGKILNGLVTFIDWGYKAVEATEKWIGDKFGEGAAEKFNSFTGLLTKTMNLVIALGIAAAAMGGKGRGGLKGPKGPKRGIKNQLKRTRTKIKRFFDPKRADKLKRAKNLKKIRADRLSRVDKFGRLKKFAKAKKFVKGAFSRTREVIDGARGFGSNILQKGRGFGSNILQKGRGFGSNILQKGRAFGSNIIQKGKGALSWVDDFAQKQLANVDNVIGGIKSQGAKWGKSIGGALDTMNPMKLGEKVKGLLKGKMDKIVKNNDLIKQIKNLNVKDATKNIKKILEGAKKNKNILKLRQGLKAAKAAKIGGVDAVIAAIIGLLDYAAFGESPINAILRAIGGLLGYTAGFAIGAPFGGAPGFITGMAGAFVGEFASKMIAKGLAKTKLGKIQDPIMSDGRMLVRDPDGKDLDEESTEKAKTEKKTITTKIQSYSENPIRALASGDRSRIEQALYEMRIQANLMKGGYDFVGNPKYKKDVDLIMEHGLAAVRVDGGRVTLQANANNIVPTKGTSNKINGVSSSASYEEETGKEVVIINPKNNSSTTPPSTEEGKVIAVESGSGSGSDYTASLYRG